MKTVRFDAAGLKCVALEPSKPGDYPLVVILHGWGDWGESYLDIGEVIGQEERYRFVFPTGTVPVPGALFGWFDLDLNFRDFAKRASKARPLLNNLLNELLERYNLPASKVVLGGFSQGGMLTFEGGLRYRHNNERLAGLIALSSLLPADDPQSLPELEKVIAEVAQSEMPILIAHGTYDQVIPVQAGRASEATLKHAGVPVTYFEFPGYHQISLEELNEIEVFLSRIL
ncbi:hypothetical protein [Candidatus Chlorohelix sp.]|uniref:alpha/beta hydrolase n=1 Tax=Candidatus Chlorohelix sp. TaxID=3139201 RepID=UPI003042B8E1